MKKCTKCGIEKSLSEFHKNKSSKDGLTSKCGKCSTNQSKEWYRKNPEVKRKANLLREYGITLEDFENMRTAQNNQCAICKNTFKNSIDTCVDHCHATKKVRGLLCNHCNKAIGLFHDSIQSLTKAIEYLSQCEIKT